MLQHFKTEAWQRSRKADRAVVGTVVFLTAFYSALTVHDIWFYGTILSDEVTVLLTGTVTATLEPVRASSAKERFDAEADYFACLSAHVWDNRGMCTDYSGHPE